MRRNETTKSARQRTLMAHHPTRSNPVRGSSQVLQLRDAHDSFGKYTFGNPRVASEEFRFVPPRKLSSQIDWRTLRREPTELVDAALRKRFPDLRFSARFRQTR
jgi:hypothetical protein